MDDLRSNAAGLLCDGKNGRITIEGSSVTISRPRVAKELKMYAVNKISKNLSFSFVEYISQLCVHK